MTVSFVTFGCRLNRAEALEIEAAYAAAGWSILPPHTKTQPDRIIIRGCSVTEKARRDCEKEISRLKRKWPTAKIIRSGCLDGARTNPKQDIDCAENATVLPFGTSRAYLKVQDGCSQKCTFCIVPHFRGAPISVPFSKVIDRAYAFLDAGYTELIVTGCNLALYHSAGRNLVDLIDALSDLTDIPYRIRIGSLEPGTVISTLPTLIAERNERICPFLHLSLQSASPPILAAMRRPYSIDIVHKFCEDARSRIGESVLLGADVITGFPKESIVDFTLTRDFLSYHNFAHVHVFPFSERPGTVAATMLPRVPKEIRHARARLLIEDARQRENAYAKSFLGKIVTVCTEKSCRSGHTAEGLMCRLNHDCPRRSLVRAIVTSVDKQVLSAEFQSWEQ